MPRGFQQPISRQGTSRRGQVVTSHGIVSVHLRAASACRPCTRPCPPHRFVTAVQCKAGNPFNRRGKSDRKAKAPGLFEVKVVTPPPQSLGIYALPPYTHNGEEIEIDGQGYIVTRLVLKYKLVKGKYARDHNRLEVQPTGRYFLNMMLENLVKAKYVGPTGSQD